MTDARDDTRYGDLSEPAWHDAVRDILTQSFDMGGAGDDPFASWRSYRDLVGQENFRHLRRGDQVVAGLCTYRMGQWWGGTGVPLGGIAAVGVAPEHRGTGAGKALMAEQLRELRDEGIPLAALYASTQRLYRAVGFEQAGSCCRWQLDLREVGRPDRELPASRIEPDDPVLRGVHRLRGMATPGTLDRNEAIWERVWRERERPVHAYLLGPRDDPQGYVVFTHTDADRGYGLDVRDQVALTPAAVRRLGTLLSDHRSICRTVRWNGPAHEPLLTGLPEQRAELHRWERWLLRVVDVPAALAARGYAAEAEAELHLEIDDDTLPDNAGRWVLRVEGGQAEVEAGGRGDLRTTARGLAPLYAGLFRAPELARLGFVEGTDATLAIADRLFSGPEPWMSDQF